MKDKELRNIVETMKIMSQKIIDLEKIEELTNKLGVLLSYIGVKLEEVPPSDVKYKVVPIKDEK